jgi:hypothetical protein
MRAPFFWALVVANLSLVGAQNVRWSLGYAIEPPALRR